MPIVIFDNSNACNRANIKQISTARISHLKAEKIAFLFFLIFCSNRAVLSCLLYAACQTKRKKMEREKSRGKRGEGGWRTRDGGGADMHLSPISSNTFHNSSALSLLPRLRTISPDAH